ncbi:phospholipase C [Motilibacter rhizosphaerae]|uniref:phospholipase C n=1 Tax=Motilibacter rhizosphaerae TaxID=598652 RepID=A0A4Q7NSI7_9ACTN|nr:phospholipase C, phosphocholine-specific [Motilibacter rhizosphaerae]RZS89820.1 phospholipase C [Motilibacter rhizosphaerae]
MSTDRRTFLKMLGLPAAAAVLPGFDMQKALAIEADVRHGSIEDVDHVIVLMQENRSFDHYFGSLRGVRGFADPRPVRLPSGKSVWHQPDGDGELLPFRPPVQDLGQTFLPDPPHGWNDTHAAWNGGRHDQFVPNKGTSALTYHTRADLPWQYALADAFTVCDNYHCSLLGPTDPNRYHMWTGWVGNDGKGGGPVITNAEAGYDWSTYPERLQRAGISWKVYQDVGEGLDAAGSWGWTSDPFIGNYGDNSLLYFHQYQDAQPGNPLADRAKTGTDVKAEDRDPERLLDQFRADVASGQLPQVSWIVAPEAYSEHPNWEPDFGTWYVAQVLQILAEHPEVWSRMALFITYDEEGGFFDHLVPPTPPTSAADGISTVPTTNEVYPGSDAHPAGPYGLGMRVPMIVVSPWTRGGYVDSELFDHTSLIRFLEKRFGAGNPDLVESNITPWRRAVVGDLTSAFDFESPGTTTALALPETDSLKPQDLTRQPDEELTKPADQQVPPQERGVRPARALPYEVHADGVVRAGALHLTIANTGDAAVVLQLRSADPASQPRSYTVGAGHDVTDVVALPTGDYDLELHGPNGFFRSWRGGTTPGRLAVAATTTYHKHKVRLDVSNPGSERIDVTLRERYTGETTRVSVRPGASRSETWSLGSSGGWYDVTLTVQQDPGLVVGYAGHVESGRQSISDPLMGGLV